MITKVGMADEDIISIVAPPYLFPYSALYVIHLGQTQIIFKAGLIWMTQT